MTSDYSLSDISAVTGGNRNNGNGLFGGEGSWFIIILFLFAFLGWGGNGGCGGNGAGRGGVADNYVLATDFATIERKIDGVNSGLCDGFYATAQQINGVQAATAQGFANAELSRCNQQAALMQMLYTMSMDNQKCCCETQRLMERGFADTNYNLATQGCETRTLMQTNTRDLIDNQNANARAILDALTQQRIEAKDEKIAAQNQQIFSLQLAASQAAQNNFLLGELKPCPRPAYLTCNPFTGQYAAPNPGCCGQYGNS